MEAEALDELVTWAQGVQAFKAAVGTAFTLPRTPLVPVPEQQGTVNTRVEGVRRISVDSHPLFQTLPQLWSFLGASERCSLRVTCRDGRSTANRLFTRLCIFDKYDRYRRSIKLAPASSKVVVAKVEHLLASGVQPETLVLRLSGGRRTAEDMSAIGLGVLSAIIRRQRQQQQGAGSSSAGAGGAVGFRPPTDLRLQGVPLGTPGLAAAVAQALPSLQRLTLRLFKLPWASNARVEQPFEPDSAAAEGAVALLSAVGPGLRHLSVECNSFDFWTPQLLSAIRNHCTGLVSLSLKCDVSEGKPLLPAGLLELVQSLARLQSLKLCAAGRGTVWGPFWAFRRRFKDAENFGVLSFYTTDGADQCSTVASTLSHLTGLRRLVVRGYAAPAVVPALQHLPLLVHLDMPQADLSVERDVPPLSAAKQLTHLRALRFTRDTTCAGAAAGAAGTAAGPSSAGGRAAQEFAPCISLPPSLRSLELTGLVRPSDLQAVELPPSLTRLQLQGLQLGAGGGGSDSDDDEDEDPEDEDQDEDQPGGAWGPPHQLGPRGRQRRSELAMDLAGVRAVCRLLVGRLAESELCNPFEVVVSHDPADSELSLVGLFESLAPLQLRRLDLSGMLLYDEEVEAIAKHMTSLEELDLSTVWSTAELPALGRGLRGLRTLKAVLEDGGNEFGSDVDRVVEEFRQLFVAARNLRCLHLDVVEHEHELHDIWQAAVENSLRPAMEGAKFKLAQAGRGDVELVLGGDVVVTCEEHEWEDVEGKEEDWGGREDG